MKKKAGSIPFRIINEAVMICLVSSRKRKNKFVLPKGAVFTKEKRRQAAIRETLEEAGLKGPLSRASIKVKAASTDLDKTIYSIKFFAMLVEDELDDWAEMTMRERRWVELRQLPEQDMINRDIDILKSQQFQIMIEELLQQT